MRDNWLRTMSQPGVSEEKREILRDTALKARDRSITYSYVVLSTWILHVIRPLVNIDENNPRAWDYPFYGGYYIDKGSNRLYVIFYLMQVRFIIYPLLKI